MSVWLLRSSLVPNGVLGLVFPNLRGTQGLPYQKLAMIDLPGVGFHLPFMCPRAPAWLAGATPMPSVIILAAN